MHVHCLRPEIGTLCVSPLAYCMIQDCNLHSLGHYSKQGDGVMFACRVHVCSSAICVLLCVSSYDLMCTCI